jgi:hypothetical protein
MEDGQVLKLLLSGPFRHIRMGWVIKYRSTNQLVYAGKIVLQFPLRLFENCRIAASFDTWVQFYGTGLCCETKKSGAELALTVL